MWRVSYAVGVLLIGLGLFLAVGSAYGYTQLADQLPRAEQRLAEAEGEQELRWRQVDVADIEDDMSTNIVTALVGTALAAGGVGLIVLTRRRRLRAG
ncbi:hypothetical protein ACFQY4_36140 [Catellatospora bangladeshensis]|uniref:Uncharacterized protein n=1 Tax=Catellatospora bangladeshensis TaxID=310355 RepID=A0A8J3JLV9_9ACTN|nr:hypothetical protein [Catellatospora bangladeshensis]GIF81063.1 hypothetical protein Cba03nite_24120 [Catellatospora bangladeshensis]